MNGVLRILRSGARWQNLPVRFPLYRISHCRFRRWVCADILRQVLEALTEDLRVRGELSLFNCFIAATLNNEYESEKRELGIVIDKADSEPDEESRIRKTLWMRGTYLY
jgi:transposase